VSQKNATDLTSCNLAKT